MTHLTLNKHLATEADTQAIGAKLAAAIPAGAIIFLQGQLGAGKTTFTRGFLRGLGFADKVKSPTYTLVEPYEVQGRQIYHFDLYRLENPAELEEIGARDYFSPNAICLIEWPEKGIAYLPEPDIVCLLAISDTKRTIQLDAGTTAGKEILAILV